MASTEASISQIEASGRYRPLADRGLWQIEASGSEHARLQEDTAGAACARAGFTAHARHGPTRGTSMRGEVRDAPLAHAVVEVQGSPPQGPAPVRRSAPDTLYCTNRWREPTSARVLSRVDKKGKLLRRGGKCW